MAYYFPWLATSTSGSLFWNAFSGATGYRIDISDANGISGVYTNSIFVGNITSVLISSLGLSSGTYYLIVRAIDSASGETDASSELTLVIP